VSDPAACHVRAIVDAADSTEQMGQEGLTARKRWQTRAEKQRSMRKKIQAYLYEVLELPGSFLQGQNNEPLGHFDQSPERSR
jgi:hypothetical protein